MERERDYRKLLDDSIIIAFSALRNFFKNIDLDSDLFSHAFDTQIKIDYTEDITEGECSAYNPNDGKKDAIYIGIDYLDGLYNSFEDGFSYNAIMLDVANSIVHELIHKLRIITLKEEVTLENVSESIQKNADLYHKTYERLKEYDDILVLSTLKNKRNLSKYVPIKVYIYRENYYTFIAYNKKTKSYDIFEKKYFKTKYNGNYDTFMENLAWEASSDLKIIPTTSYRSPLISQHNEKVYNSMDLYSLPVDDPKNPIKNRQDVINRLSYIRNSIDSQILLEESFTEVLSNMIIMSRNRSYFDIEDLCTRVSNNTDSINHRCIAYLINKGGIELIRNFILASYQEEFRNVFYDFYKDDYPELLRLFSEAKEKNNYTIGNSINRITENRVLK